MMHNIKPHEKRQRRLDGKNFFMTFVTFAFVGVDFVALIIIITCNLVAILIAPLIMNSNR